MSHYMGQPMTEDPAWLQEYLDEAPPETAQKVAQGVRVGELLERSRTYQAWKHYELTETLLVAIIGSIGTAVGMALGGYLSGFFIKGESR